MEKFNNVYKWIVSLVIAMVVIINSKNVANGQILRNKIDVVIFLAPLLDESQLGVYKGSVRKMIHDHLDIGDDKVRVALINTANGGAGSNVWQPLTGDRAAIVRSLGEWNPTATTTFYSVAAFQVCKSSACEFEKNDRAKVIIIHLQYYTFSADHSGYELTVDLRRLGAYLYVVNNPAKFEHFAHWTASSRRTFSLTERELGETTSLKMPEIIEIMEADLCGFCGWNTSSREACAWKLYEADDPFYFGSDHAMCTGFVRSCRPNQSACDWACNRHWSWENSNKDLEYDCSQLRCGPMRRDPILPPSTKAKNCIAEIDCGKLECPTTRTTTTSTSSTTTTTSTTSTTTSTTTPTTTTSIITSTISPTESITTMSTASTIVPPTSTIKSTANESDSTTDAKKAVDNESASSESKVLPVWVIAVIVVVAVVLLLAIVVGIVVVKKRKRHAREKRAKMERAKRMEFEKREKIGMEKKRHDAAGAARSNKSASNAKPSIGSKSNLLETSISIISKSRGADASIHADMSMATGATRVSKKPSAAACKIKSSKAAFALSFKFPDGKHESKGRGEKPSKKIVVDGSKMAAKSSQEKTKGKMESKSTSRVVEEKKSEPRKKMGSSSKVSKKK